MAQDTHTPLRQLAHRLAHAARTVSHKSHDYALGWVFRDALRDADRAAEAMLSALGPPSVAVPTVFPELRHRGHALRVDPVGTTLAAVAHHLALGVPVHVVLEPGDATRYELLLAPAHGFLRLDHPERPLHYHPADAPHVLLATRLATDAASVLFDLNAAFWDDAVAQLAGYNDWTAHLLTWWLRCLAHQLGV